MYQKGLDLLAEAVDELAGLGATLVVLGSGERRYVEMWREAAARRPHTIGVRIGYGMRRDCSWNVSAAAYVTECVELLRGWRGPAASLDVRGNHA